MESLIDNADCAIAIYHSPTVRAEHPTIHVAKRAIETFFVVGIETMPKFASYSETKDGYALIYSKTNYSKFKRKN